MIEAEATVERPSSTGAQDARRRDARGRFGRAASCRTAARQRLADAQLAALAAEQAAVAGRRAIEQAVAQCAAAEAARDTARMRYDALVSGGAAGTTREVRLAAADAVDAHVSAAVRPNG